MNNDISPELKEKVKKNILYLSLFSIVMLFAGLTSAYLVVQKDSFWVVIDMPVSFYISTSIILLSSLTIFLALRAAKSDKIGQTKILIGITLVLGVLFSVYQYVGWGDLIKKGSYFTGPIVNENGKYGSYFTAYYKGEKIQYDNYKFYLNDTELNPEIYNDFKNFASKLRKNKEKKYDLDGVYGENFVLYFADTLVTYNRGELYIGDRKMDQLQTVKLDHFSDNIVNERGDFFLKGEYGQGKDFYITYRGKVLDYKNRKFYLDGQELSALQYDKLSDSKNTASSFIYIFSFLHWLHVLGGIFYLLILFRRSLKNEFNSRNYLKIKLGNIYWHFLGGLWIYLFLFLIFIN